MDKRRLSSGFGFAACIALSGAACTPSAGSSAPEKTCEAGLYIYDVDRPTVDAAYASRMAALFGVHADPQLAGAVWFASEGHRVVTVQEANGGVEFHDHGKLESPSYTIDPSKLTAEHAKRIASEALRPFGRLPEGATLSRVSLANGPGQLPNHWEVVYELRIPAGVTASCAEPTATVRGAFAVVLVGNEEPIGLEWSFPELTRRPAAVSDVAGVLQQGPQAADATTGPLQVIYEYVGETMPHLDPQAVDAWGQVRPATRFRPQLVEDRGVETPSFNAGSEIEVAAPAVEGGTMPYRYRWQAQLAGLPYVVTLSESPALSARLPANTVGLMLRVTDAEGMWVERSYQVGGP